VGDRPSASSRLAGYRAPGRRQRADLSTCRRTAI
jgi:hypothetical protein